MTDGAAATRATMIPCLCYRDAAAAVDWLGRAFGFEPLRVFHDEAGGIVHAELGFGNGMVMVGPLRDSDYGRHVRAPDSLGGVQTQTVYAVVADADAHHARAVSAGAGIVIPLKDEGYGGRGYSCRDPEGHIWSFGTYDPWAQ